MDLFFVISDAEGVFRIAHQYVMKYEVVYDKLMLLLLNIISQVLFM